MFPDVRKGSWTQVADVTLSLWLGLKFGVFRPFKAKVHGPWRAQKIVCRLPRVPTTSVLITALRTPIQAGPQVRGASGWSGQHICIYPERAIAGS
jgi:hypothetical protein